MHLGRFMVVLVTKHGVNTSLSFTYRWRVAPDRRSTAVVVGKGVVGLACRICYCLSGDVAAHDRYAARIRTVGNNMMQQTALLHD